MRILFTLIVTLSPFYCFPQDSLWNVTGFVDLYYAYDFNKPVDKYRQFTTQPARHNEFNLNWGYIKVDYAKERIRSTFALQTGTFVEINYAYEPELIRIIYQASAGYQLTPNIWIDAGIMPSHIGLESTVSLDNWNYSRNIQTDYLPYYQAGVHLSIGVSEKVQAKFVLLNGFQIVKETNDAKSIGLLINYYPHKNWEVGYSNYFGNEAPSDSVMINDEMQKLSPKHRFFNNLFIKGKLSEKFQIAFGGEYNLQEHFTDTKIGNWYNAMTIIKYNMSDRWSLAARGELFHDKDQIVVGTGTANGFKVTSFTLTLNYYPTEKIAFRAEGRAYESQDAIYRRSNSPLTNRDSFLSASMALKF